MKKIIVKLVYFLLIIGILMSCNSKTTDNNDKDAKTDLINQNIYGEANIEQDKDILNVQVTTSLDITLDPAINTALDGVNVLEHLFEGLLKYDENGDLVGGIAESYKESADGLTWVFKLRDNLKWSDGTDLNAYDLVYNWKRVADPNTKSSYAYDLLKQVVGFYEAQRGNLDALSITARDKKTFVVNLTTPCAYFDKICAFSVLFPVKKEVVENNEDWTKNKETYVSNGPYYLYQYDKDKIVLNKNEYYYDKDKINFNQIVYYFKDKKEDILNMYEEGKLDLMTSLPINMIDDLNNTNDYNIANIMGTYYLAFNINKEPYNDIRVRKALSLAIDRNYIANVIMHKTRKPARNFVGPGVSDISNKQKKYFETVTEEMYQGPFFDNDNYEANFYEAQKLLKEAGFGVNKKFPDINYLMNDETYNKEVADYLVETWGKLGINVNVNQYSWSEFSKKRRNMEFDIVRNRWTCDWDDPSNILSVFETNSGNNSGKYSSKKFDQLLNEAINTNFDDDHYYKLHMAERILLNDYAIIPIAYYEQYWLQQTSLKNVWLSPYGVMSFKYAYFE